MASSCWTTTVSSAEACAGCRSPSCERRELPDHIPTLEELYAEVGTTLDLSLDVKDPEAFAPTVAVARAAGGGAPERLWLCHHDWQVVARGGRWRPRCAWWTPPG